MSASGSPLAIPAAGGYPLIMSEQARKVREEALRLEPEARAALAADLLASLDDGELAPEDLAKLNAAIAEGRAEIAAGLGIDGEQVLQELRQKRPA